MSEDALTERDPLEGVEFPLDRDDPVVAGRAIDALLPGSVRQQILTALHECCRIAHNANPGSWSVTLGRRGKVVRLNVGRVFAFDFSRDAVQVIVEAQEVGGADYGIPGKTRDRDSGAFRAVPGIEWRRFTHSEFIDIWDTILEATRHAIDLAAVSATRSQWYRSHSPGVIRYVEQAVGGSVPDPTHDTKEAARSRRLDDLVTLIEARYPDWTGFSDPRFEKDEVDYKRAAAKKAGDLLAKSEFDSLLAAGDTKELIRRIKVVARTTNLLFMGIPSKGDLALLNREDVDQPVVLTALRDLLYGEGATESRIQTYADTIAQHDWPVRWALPTYLLFVTAPQSELFIKPGATHKFLALLGEDRKLDSRPNEADYRFMIEAARALHGALSEFDPRDMIDIQSFIWVCASVSKSERYWKIAPGPGAVHWSRWRDEGFAAAGWDALGDIADVPYEAFLQRSGEIAEGTDGWTVTGSKQVWRFVHEIKEGDRIVANQGTKKILGVGTVIGPQYWVEGEELGHRLPVRWDSVDPIEVSEGGWKKTLIELSEDKFTELTRRESTPAQPPSTLFAKETFEALRRIRENPTQAHYAEHKDELSKYVEQPMRALFADIAAELSKPMRSALETERRIFGRFAKNDWGRGGAWDYYWGAFYRKGGKRTEGAQLFIWINQDHLEYGFAFGEYSGKESARFEKNARLHGSTVGPILSGFIDNDRLRVGSRGKTAEVDVGKWLQNPTDLMDGVRVTLPSADVVAKTRDELTREIGAAFEQLFPLMLLGVDGDPVEAIRQYIGEDEPSATNPPYSVRQCARDTGFDEDAIQRWVRGIERKGQAVFFGPPGTGKTFVAEHVAKHLVGGGTGFVELVQFHPAYAYEDFMQGIRPDSDGAGQLVYEMKPGRFLEFCAKASRTDDRCVLIIDEINRANLSRVFGELMYLLEYRDAEAPLAGGDAFSVPSNVRLIGTMNTADRSIALVDHALRRRFAFVPLRPDFDILRKYHADDGDLPIDALIDLLEQVNQEIGDPHYEVGISFFMRSDLFDQIEDIWRMEIEPYLEEYFFDQPDKVGRFRWEQVAGKLGVESE